MFLGSAVWGMGSSGQETLCEPVTPRPGVYSSVWEEQGSRTVLREGLCPPPPGVPGGPPSFPG